MKTLLTLILISICSFAFGQSPKVNKYKEVADQSKKEEPTFKFDELNAAIVIERNQALKNFQKADSAMQEIARRMLLIKRIDFTTINADSTRITPEGIFLKLKTKK